MADVPASGPAVSASSGTRATAFGLDVRSALRLSFLDGATTEPTGRTLELCQDPVPGLPRGWPGGERTLCLQRRRDGSAYFRIDEHPRAGYLVWGEGRGSYLLSPDAEHLYCSVGDRPPEVWQRFLIGQVLPFAALVSGLEVLHASAVVLDGCAVAFVGPSGAGKTSLALELCRHGASFLADDVVAVESPGGAPTAQPGPPLAGVGHAEARRVRERGASLGGPVVALGAGEQMMRVAGASSPHPLTVLFFLERRAQGTGGPTFETCTEARPLLASTFNLVLDSHARMSGLLDLCARLARARVERIAIPPSVDAAALATAVMARLERPA